MNNKTVLVGCDDTSKLSLILNSLKGTPTNNFISAIRVSDLVNILESITPSLIILSFPNTQSAVYSISDLISTHNTPVICLTHKAMDHPVFMDNNLILFTLPFNYALQQNMLSQHIGSILRLRKIKIKRNLSQSFSGQSDKLLQINHNKNLSRYVLELDQKATALKRIRKNLVSLYPEVDMLVKSKLISIVSSIKSSTGDKKHWDDFKVYFENINPGFVKKLIKKHPSLTLKDIKYCCYLKMNMSNDEIRHILGINKESVRTHKYRLKKKLTLSKDQDLRIYTQTLDSKQA